MSGNARQRFSSNTTARFIASILLLLFMPSLALAQESNTISATGQEHFEAPFPSGGNLRMYIRSCGIHVTGSDENKITIRFSAPDSDSLRNVHVKFKQNGGRGDLDISGGPSNNFQIDITIPRQSNLYFRMFAGELDLDHVDGNKDLQIHAGQMDVTLPNVADYAPIDASVTTGDLEAGAFGVSKGGLFRSFRTDTALHSSAAGKYSLYAHVGAGELDIH